MHICLIKVLCDLETFTDTNKQQNLCIFMLFHKEVCNCEEI